MSYCLWSLYILLICPFYLLLLCVASIAQNDWTPLASQLSSGVGFGYAAIIGGDSLLRLFTLPSFARPIISFGKATFLSATLTFGSCVLFLYVFVLHRSVDLLFDSRFLPANLLCCLCAFAASAHSINYATRVNAAIASVDEPP